MNGHWKAYDLFEYDIDIVHNRKLPTLFGSVSYSGQLQPQITVKYRVKFKSVPVDINDFIGHTHCLLLGC